MAIKNMIDLRQGDCLEVMDDLIKEGVTVDAIIADDFKEKLLNLMSDEQ